MMLVNWIRSAALNLIVFSAFHLAAGAQDTPAGWQFHVDSKHGFTIAYPPAMTFFPEPVKAQLLYLKFVTSIQSPVSSTQRMTSRTLNLKERD